jgi:hypothetical protein
MLEALAVTSQIVQVNKHDDDLGIGAQVCNELKSNAAAASNHQQLD